MIYIVKSFFFNEMEFEKQIAIFQEMNLNYKILKLKNLKNIKEKKIILIQTPIAIGEEEKEIS